MKKKTEGWRPIARQEDTKNARCCMKTINQWSVTPSSLACDRYYSELICIFICLTWKYISLVLAVHLKIILCKCDHFVKKFTIPYFAQLASTCSKSSLWILRWSSTEYSTVKEPWNQNSFWQKFIRNKPDWGHCWCQIHPETFITWQISQNSRTKR